MMIRRQLTLCCTLVFASLATWAQADPVQLRSADGSLDMQAELIEFSDTHFVVKTALGTINVKRDGVECTGAACPGTTQTNAIPLEQDKPSS